MGDTTANLDWGVAGAKRAAARSDVVVVVDVLRFTSAVVAAVSAGALVYPYRGNDPAAFASQTGAELARGNSRFSLSPLSYSDCDRARVVLPSPNGSTVTAFAGRSCPVFAGALINATAAGKAAAALAAERSSGITVIACGERPLAGWEDERSYEFRPAIEDWLGAGAVLAALGPDYQMTAEAVLGVTTFQAVGPMLGALIANSESGLELNEKGRAEDVDFCSRLDTHHIAPLLLDGCFARPSSS
jgi:2-phosphosulfolactate phosphatase